MNRTAVVVKQEYFELLVYNYRIDKREKDAINYRLFCFFVTWTLAFILVYLIDILE